MALIVTGSLGIDTVHTPTDSAEGVLGGSAAYFAAAASFFHPARLVAAAGGDWPEEHRRLLERIDGIVLDGLEVRPESQTFAWGGRYHENMNSRETLFTHLGVLEEQGPAVPASFRDSKYVFLANTHPVEQRRLLDEFPDRTLAVADTMDLWINIARPELMDLIGNLDGLVLNDEEAEQLTEIRNSVSAGRRILEWGPRFVVVKKGEHGAVLVHKDGVAVLPAFPADDAQVVDPTGAGDSFAGGMMGHLAAVDRSDLRAIQTAMAWGTVVASFTIQAFSLHGLLDLDRAAIDERMLAFQEAARVAGVDK